VTRGTGGCGSQLQVRRPSSFRMGLRQRLVSSCESRHSPGHWRDGWRGALAMGWAHAWWPSGERAESRARTRRLSGAGQGRPVPAVSLEHSRQPGVRCRPDSRVTRNRGSGGASRWQPATGRRADLRGRRFARRRSTSAPLATPRRFGLSRARREMPFHCIAYVGTLPIARQARRTRPASMQPTRPDQPGTPGR
jgi:hypothetical protein